MNITQINSILRALQLIPLVLVFTPIFRSYYERRNSINGLRQTRLVLVTLIFALIFSNFYFLVFSIFRISRAVPTNQIIVIVDKIINIGAYWLLYFLFCKAKDHDKKL